MSIDRRKVLAGMAGLGATTALPAWGQFSSGIGPQGSDPYAQVDPYANEGRGHPAPYRTPSAKGNDAFSTGKARDMIEVGELEEIAMGRASFPGEIRKDGGLYPDKKLQEALSAFCAPFFKVAQRGHLPWTVVLLNNSSPNAWAMPGGHIAVNAGLIAICDHPGHLGATIAHEIGHVDMEHWRRNDTFEGALALAEKVGFDPAEIPLDLLLPESKGKVRNYFHMLTLSYGREQEFEADAHMIFIFERLGMDPIRVLEDAQNFERMSRAQGHHKIDDVGATHPPSEERRRRIEGLILGQPRLKREFLPDGWDRLKAAIPTLPAFKRV